MKTVLIFKPIMADFLKDYGGFMDKMDIYLIVEYEKQIKKTKPLDDCGKKARWSGVSI